MSCLYVLGARQRRTVLRREEEWHLYESALILEVNTETGSVTPRLEYRSPSDARAGDRASIVFKAGSILGGKLYACTSTEMLAFDLPDFQITNYLSLPCFNDLHHVTVDSSGNLLVANTGLDMVLRLTPWGDVLAEWDVLGEHPWTRFSAAVDYRRVESTKPHRSHPNFVFGLNGNVWAMRFIQRDAVCLDNPRKRIDIGIGSPHDGLVCGEKIFFTTVDGHILTANRNSLRVNEVVNLNAMSTGSALLGWCRGLFPVDKTKLWVGFTRVRKTKFQENLLWVCNVFREGMAEKPTHLALYDIASRSCLQEIDLEKYGMNVVFSIFQASRKSFQGEHSVPSTLEFGDGR